MAQKETQTDKTQKSSSPNLLPPEFTAMERSASKSSSACRRSYWKRSKK